MKLKTMVFAGLFLAASVAMAQGMVAPPIKTLQVAPAAQPTQLTLNTPEAIAAREIAQLKRENARLQAENDQLKAKVQGYSVLGGSQVHAYCAAGTNTVSKNTAGAENNCASAGYTCEEVSGLCRTSCQTSNMCAGGFTCDTGIQQCVRTG